MANQFLKEPKFDFDKNEFVISMGKFVMISGLELIKQKIQKVIRTERNKYKIYDGTNYGIALEKKLISNTLPLNYVKSEIERAITESLLDIVGVTSVNSFSVEQDGDLLTTEFDVTTEFGALKEVAEL